MSLAEKRPKLQGGALTATQPDYLYTLKRRRVNFSGWDKYEPRTYFHNSKAKSYAFCASSLENPMGEQFFINSIQNYQSEIDQLNDPELQHQTRLFCEQEGQHRREGIGLSTALVKHGFSLDKAEKPVMWLYNIYRRLPRAFQLAITCGNEAATSLQAKWFLTNPTVNQAINANIAEFWLWHAFEEIEHKAVVYDIFQSVSGSYFTRILGMIVGVPLLILSILWLQYSLLRQDKDPIKWRDVVDTYDLFLGKMGALTYMVPHLAKYFRPSYHPLQLDDSELLAKWTIRFAQYERPY